MSLDYYCNKLGFQDVDHWSHDALLVGRSLKCAGERLVHLHQWAQGPGMSMYLYLASTSYLAALYQEYQAKAVKITETPTNQHWGMREMLVEDVDGHTLKIGVPRPHE